MENVSALWIVSFSYAVPTLFESLLLCIWITAIASQLASLTSFNPLCCLCKMLQWFSKPCKTVIVLITHKFWSPPAFLTHILNFNNINVISIFFASYAHRLHSLVECLLQSPYFLGLLYHTNGCYLCFSPKDRPPFPSFFNAQFLDLQLKVSLCYHSYFHMPF